MTTIAVMQPYFLPYAGYFRLMCRVDAFVVLDTVQFPRRGWVHRNRLLTRGGCLDWLTLPLARAALNESIANMHFHDDVETLWSERLQRFPAAVVPSADAAPLAAAVAHPQGRVAAFLVNSLEISRRMLGFTTPMVKMPDLDLSTSADAQERILAICRALGADDYVNLPGGRPYYDPQIFARHGIRLRFLPDYRSDMSSILQRLSDTPAALLRSEIESNS